MKKRLAIGVLAAVLTLSGGFLVACSEQDVSIATANANLQSIIADINTSAYFGNRSITINSTSISSRLPAYITSTVARINATEDTKWYEVSQIYDSAFAVAYKYIEEFDFLLNLNEEEGASFTITESGQSALNKLNSKISILKTQKEKQIAEIKDFNAYASNGSLLKYKKGYQKFIRATIDVAQALSDFNSIAFSDVRYIELAGPTIIKYRSLYKDYCLDSVEDYFRLLIESVNAKNPADAISYHEYKIEVRETYTLATQNYKNLVVNMVSTNTSGDLTEESIAKLKGRFVVANDESRLFRKSIKEIGWHSFIFKNDCELDRYSAAKRSNYIQIITYARENLVNWTNHLQSYFS